LIRPTILAMFVGSCVFATATVSLAESKRFSLNAEQAQTEAVHFLVDLVRIDTQDPPGDESKVAHYIEGVLKSEGIESEILEAVPGRASIVARLKGDGKKRPLLLMGHEDVVPVDRSHWTVDPFAANERDGVIYGRGASDDKAMLAANLEVFLQLKRMKVPLDRDVIFLSEASEEMSSLAGMATIVDRNWDKIDCEFALNEGGGSLVENGTVKYFGVATSEKLPRGLRLEATGSSGHGSVPRIDNAVVHLAAAVAKAGTWDTPSRLNETTRAFFERLATISPPEEAAWYRNVLDVKVQEELKRKKPQYYSMVRTSVVPTVLKAGYKSNVIPPSAEATRRARTARRRSRKVSRDAGGDHQRSASKGRGRGCLAFHARGTSQQVRHGNVCRFGTCAKGS
jgi:acetylornithine deacetylase/succinyl-diaminopimelate desuccinylase-like protein